MNGEYKGELGEEAGLSSSPLLSSLHSFNNLGEELKIQRVDLSTSILGACISSYKVSLSFHFTSLHFIFPSLP